MRLPIDPFQIAASLGIRVFRTPLEIGTAGFILKEKDDELPVIYLNASDGLQRQRFTLAHELGHYVEHRDDAQIAYMDMRDELAYSGTDCTERWYNAFAAELLMPAALIKRYWAQGKSFEHIRQKLQVCLKNQPRV